jgi:hypothetical protein
MIAPTESSVHPDASSFIMHVADNFGLATNVPTNVQGPSRDLVRRAPSENVPLLRSAVKTLPRKMPRKRARNGRFVRKQSEKASSAGHFHAGDASLSAVRGP